MLKCYDHSQLSNAYKNKLLFNGLALLHIASKLNTNQANRFSANRLKIKPEEELHIQSETPNLFAVSQWELNRH